MKNWNEATEILRMNSDLTQVFEQNTGEECKNFSDTVQVKYSMKWEMACTSVLQCNNLMIGRYDNSVGLFGIIRDYSRLMIQYSMGCTVECDIAVNEWRR